MQTIFRKWCQDKTYSSRMQNSHLTVTHTRRNLTYCFRRPLNLLILKRFPLIVEDPIDQSWAEYITVVYILFTDSMPWKTSYLFIDSFCVFSRLRTLRKGGGCNYQTWILLSCTPNAWHKSGYWWAGFIVVFWETWQGWDSEVMMIGCLGDRRCRFWV